LNTSECPEIQENSLNGHNPQISEHLDSIPEEMELQAGGVEEPAKFKLVEAYKGGLRMLHDGYAYVRDKESNDKMYV